MYGYCVHAWCQRRPEEGLGISGTGVTSSYYLPCECCEPNPGLFQEQQVLSTVEPSLLLCAPHLFSVLFHLTSVSFVSELHHLLESLCQTLQLRSMPLVCGSRLDLTDLRGTVHIAKCTSGFFSAHLCTSSFFFCRQ